MRSDMGIAPFDAVLLAGDLNNTQYIPICPMLTQGWFRLPEGLRRMLRLEQPARYLLPALWTTFSKRGVEVLQKEFFK
jgi:hypothetical protein